MYFTHHKLACICLGLSISWMVEMRTVTCHVKAVQYMQLWQDHIFLKLLFLWQFSFKMQEYLVISMYIKLRNIPWQFPPATPCINTNLYARLAHILQMLWHTMNGDTSTGLKFRFTSCYCLVPSVKCWISSNHYISVSFKPISNQQSIQYSLNYWVWRS